MERSVSVNYLRALTPGEELELRKERFGKIQPGTLFGLGGRRFFIAVARRNENSLWVIELSRDNIGRIISERGSVVQSILSFDEMVRLNLYEQEP